MTAAVFMLGPVGRGMCALTNGSRLDNCDGKFGGRLAKGKIGVVVGGVVLELDCVREDFDEDDLDEVDLLCLGGSV